MVYNHFGVGDQFEAFSDRYFTDRHENEWGDSINYDGEGCGPVRDFIADNAAYWIAEFHFDGLRLDATQALFDDGDDHIIARIVRECRAAAGDRTIYIVAENEPQETRLVRPPSGGGYGLDAVWNDDFHHAVMVALTGRSEAYYHDYLGAPQEFVSAAKYGYLFQGQRYDWQNYPRGSAGLDLSPGNFVHFLENHDQVANSAHGRRLHRVSPARLRAATALLLLGPQTPLLFEGQEFGSSAPFLFFADQGPELDPQIAQAARSCWRSSRACETRRYDRDSRPRGRNPERSRRDWSEVDGVDDVVALHRDLLRLRREIVAFAGRSRETGSTGRSRTRGAASAVLHGPPADERLLLVNLGADLIHRERAGPALRAAGRDRLAWVGLARTPSTAEAAAAGRNHPPLHP